MRRNFLYVFVATVVVSIVLLGGKKMLAQSGLPPQMITQAVDEHQLVTLHGNVHPMARAQYDQGAVATTMQMGHMLLVLKRSPEQETALENFIAQQADKNSPNYHKGLTAAQFGEQYGASDQDITAITTWLGSHGFQVNGVATGRNMIDFSGNAGEVQEAFHTEIHQFVTNGKSHYANATDPQIPAALAPVIAGVNSFNNFRPKPMHHKVGEFKMNAQTKKATRVSPELTLTGLTADSCYGNSSTTCYVVAPYDFATIYNLLPIWKTTCGGNPCNGTGVHIAIVSDSDVYDADYQQFRSLMGLPNLPGNTNTINRILATGNNPGVQQCGANVNTDEDEAILDVEWAGAAAPGATIDLVLAPSEAAYDCNNVSTSGEGSEYGYTSNFGGDYAAYYEVNTLLDPIVSDSYGECELDLGTGGNAFYNSLWQQAEMEGITVLTATGDSGSAGCDNPDENDPAELGLQVNGTASTPYNTAVGGTDFTYDTANATGASAYWTTTNSTSGNTQTLSANGPIPETVYNDSCANPTIASELGDGTNLITACNSETANEDDLLEPAGSSGGASACTTPSGIAASDCAGGYAKPSWQTGTGVPSDGKRDIPDLSLFAGDGTASGTYYIVCQEDAYIHSDPSYPATACNITSASTYFFVGEGGTSVAAQIMAGIVAVLDQYQGVHLGSAAFNANLYALATAEGNNCNNSGSTPLANSSPCVFRDITTGNNSVPCVASTTNCGSTISSQLGPLGLPSRFHWTPLSGGIVVTVLAAALLLVILPGRSRRLRPALALLVFGMVLGIASCGGGGSSIATGGGGTSNEFGVMSGYNATTGYDQATGLGSINASNFITNSIWK